MSSRNYHPGALGNNTRPVKYDARLKGTGTTTAMTFVEGDTLGTALGTFLTSARTGTGVYTFTTLDPFPGCISMNAKMNLASAAGTDTCGIKGAQNADNTWTFTVSCFPAGSAADLGTTDYLSLNLVFRNGINQP